MFLSIFWAWLVATALCIVSGNLPLAAAAALIFSVEALLIWSDASRVESNLTRLLEASQNPGRLASGRSAGVGLSGMGEKFGLLVDSLLYRIQVLNWQAVSRNASSLKLEESGLAQKLELGEACQELLGKLQERFRARALALVIERDLQLIVRSCGIQGRRFEASIKSMFLQQSKTLESQSATQQAHPSQPEPIRDFSIFGVASVLVFPFEVVTGREKSLGMLWLGYEAACAPLAEEGEAARQCAAELGRELSSLNSWQVLSGQARDALDSNRQKSEFIAQISHDIRSPLNNIKSILSLISLEGFRPDTAEMVEVALGNCQDVADLVEGILDFSRHQAGRLEARPAPFDLSRCVIGVASNFAVAARIKGLTLKAVCPEGIVAAKADERQIRRVLSNIIGNAIKFTRHGEIEVILLDGLNDNCWEIVVVDSGIGMTDEQVSQLFTPFTTFDRSDGSGSVQGVGLGMALSRVLIELNGGTIRASSISGKGTKFAVTIPRCADSDVIIRTEQNPEILVAGMDDCSASNMRAEISVLLVDDDIDCVDTLARILVRQGFTVIKTTTVPDAISIVNFHNISAIVSDAKIHDSGVDEILGYMRSRGVSIPLAVLSGTVDEASSRKYLSQGARAVFCKPVPLEDISVWIRAITLDGAADGETEAVTKAA